MESDGLTLEPVHLSNLIWNGSSYIAFREQAIFIHFC